MFIMVRFPKIPGLIFSKGKPKYKRKNKACNTYFSFREFFFRLFSIFFQHEVNLITLFYFFLIHLSILVLFGNLGSMPVRGLRRITPNSYTTGNRLR